MDKKRKIMIAVGALLGLTAAGLVAGKLMVGSKAEACRGGEGEAAIAACTWIIAKVPPAVLSRSGYRVYRAGKYHAAGRDAEAVADLEAVLAAGASGEAKTPETEDLTLYENLALYNEAAGKRAEALKYADLALQKGSGLPELHVMRARDLLASGKYTEALADLQLAEKQQFSSAALYITKGAIHRNLGEYEKAYVALSMAVPMSVSPGDAAAVGKELGLVCYKMRKYKEALGYLKKAQASGAPCPECPPLIAELEKAAQPKAASVKRAPKTAKKSRSSRKKRQVRGG